MAEEAVVAAPHQAEATDSNEKNINYLRVGVVGLSGHFAIIGGIVKCYI